MAKFRITGPDGGTYEVQAPDDADEAQVLDYVRQNAGGGQQQMASLSPPDAAPQSRLEQFASPQELKAPPPPTWGETAMDVGKSTGIGLAQGALGLITLPGNIEALGRMGIDKGAEMLGYEAPGASKGQTLPSYATAKAEIENDLTGKFYEPQTTAGEYARTIGEFAPMAVGGPGGMVARAARVAVPAVASETAGQLTKGTDAEPWARTGAALATSIAPRALGRMVSPRAPDPQRTAQVNLLRQEGIEPSAGQATGSRRLMFRESNARETWGAETAGRRLHERPLEQFTAAMMRRAGSNAPRATADALDDAFNNLGQRFQQLGQQVQMAHADPQLRQAIQNAVTTYERRVPDAMRSGYPREIADELVAARMGNAGNSWPAIRSRLSSEAWAARQSNPEYSRTLREMYEAIDDAVERALPQATRGQYADARGQYRNLLAIEKAAVGAGDDAASGLLTPQRMRQALVSQDKRSYARGQREMDEITRAGNVVMPQMPNSGTAARLQAAGLNAMLWGAGGSLATGNPLGFAAALGGPVGQAAYARGLMSGPVQRYLGHQTNRPALAQQGATLPIGPLTFEDAEKERIRRAMSGGR